MDPHLNNFLNVTPYQYQKEGVDYMSQHHYCILADEMGLGKSLQVLMLWLKVGGNLLIICPSYLKYNWLNEIKKLIKRDVSVAVFEKAKDFYFPYDCEMVIASYSQIKNCRHLFKWANIVAADEVHYLKQMETIRGQKFHELLYEEEPKFFIGLSGTPILNNIPELYSLLLLCSHNPRQTSGLDVSKKWKNYWHFANDLCEVLTRRIGGRTVTSFEGCTQPNVLKKYMKDKIIRRKADDYLDLPPYIMRDITVSFQDEPKLKKDWEQFNLEKTSVDSRHKRISAEKKAPFTLAHAENLIGQGLPVVIYSDHVQPAEYIAGKLGVPVITGKTPTNKRQQIVDDFQAGKYMAFVGTIRAASTGYNLVRARNLIFNDLAWVPGHNDQALKRIHRLGQEGACLIDKVIGSFQDAYIAKSLFKKSKIIREIF